MYHPAKVIEIFSTGKDVKSSDTSIQVTLEMWDENILTFQINSKLGKIAKEGDIVIVDYNMRSEERRVGKECRSRWSPYH